MKKLKLIYNPHSGDKSFKYALDPCVNAFQDGGYETQLFRTRTPEDIDYAVASLDEDCEAVVVSGGDGTVNRVVNALMRHQKNIPLGVIPSGTANDFAGYIKMPPDPEEAVRAMMNGRVVRSDLGCVNGRYFINVCGAGLFTNISQQVEKPMKDSLGKLAYYLKGIGQLPNFVPFPVRIISPSGVLEDELFLFITLNGCGAGGIKLSPQSRIDDGLLDLIALRAVSLRELAVLFVNMLKGDFLTDASIVFLREASFTVENLTELSMDYETDIDGEQGPDMPVHITCVPDALPLLVPDTYR